MIITLTGDLGSGKSTIAKKLSKKLNLKYYSTGSIFRTIAKERKLSLIELSELSEIDEKVDKEIDDYQKNLVKIKKNFILEGRLGFKFIPQSIKICLKVDIKEAANRIMKNKRVDEQFDSINQAIQELKKRRNSELKRYKKLYNINIEDVTHFDYVINTTKSTQEQVFKKVLNFIKNSI